jgi:hypothetical protein
MSSLELALAFVLLTSPADAPVCEYSYSLSVTAKNLAIDLELLCTRERPHVFVRERDWKTDVHLIRCRHKELIDAPFVIDAQRFPPRTQINDLLSLNRMIHRRLDNERDMTWSYRRESYRQALNELDRIQTTLDFVRDAHCEYYFVTVRRRALVELRKNIGEEAYYAGRLPSPVPVEYLQEIR